MTIRLPALLITCLALAGATAAEARDLWLWPFAADSIWNTPIGDGADYRGEGHFKAEGTIGADPEFHYRVSADAPKRQLLMLLASAMRAEVPVDPPGMISSSWLANTYMDMNGYKNVTEELNDIAVSPNGHVFSAGYAETWGGGASYAAADGSFRYRYDNFNTGLLDSWTGIDCCPLVVTDAQLCLNP